MRQRSESSTVVGIFTFGRGDAQSLFQYTSEIRGPRTVPEQQSIPVPQFTACMRGVPGFGLVLSISLSQIPRS